MAFFSVFRAEDDWRQLACEGGTWEDPKALHAGGKPDLIMYPLSPQGVELVRKFNEAKFNEVEQLVEAKHGAPPAPASGKPLAIDIGQHGIATRQDQFIILAISRNHDGNNDEVFLISRHQHGTQSTPIVHPGDHLLVYECTQIVGNPGSRGIVELRETQKEKVVAPR